MVFADSRPPLLFARPDFTLYVTLATLPQRAGVTADKLPWLIAKEVCDNALDSADAAQRPGKVRISVDQSGNLIVTDQGTGLPGATPERIAELFSVARPMLSSKLLRRGTRGAIGNGLRACLGFLTATRGRLIIETSRLRVELVPEIDGSSRIISSTTTIKPRQGLRLTAVAGDVAFTDEHLSWAMDACELAQQSGKPAFTGRPSPHWFDADQFRVLLRAAVGNPPVRQFLREFDGCTGSRVQTQIAAPFLRRHVADLNPAEAAALLTAAQAATKPPKPRILRPLGRDAVVSAGYAIAEGTFIEGEHAPTAEIPFLVECWSDAFHPSEMPDSPVKCALYMNRTKALAPCAASAWHGQAELSISGTELSVPIPRGPHYSIAINITAPMFRLTSDAKTPDCSPFLQPLIDAVGKAVKQAGRDIAAQMSAEQKLAASHRQHRMAQQAQEQRLFDREARQERLAEVAATKAVHMARPKIRDVVRELLPGAVVAKSAAGLYFNTRRLVYNIRDEVHLRTGKALEQGYFDNILTEIEAERGPLHPLLIRAARGYVSIPHIDEPAMPLGTQQVANFVRPPWLFNKIVVIEKDDLRYMLEQAGWDRRHDAVLMSSIGFNSRAARDFIDNNAATAKSEPLQGFGAHDADAAGTVIHHTLQHATLARGERLIEIIDLGLQPWEGFELGLSVETAPASYTKGGKVIRKAVGAYIRDRTDRAPTGETWEEWLQHSRFELNAMSSARLIEWLDQKMTKLGNGKLIPPDDVLQDHFGEQVRDRTYRAVTVAIDRKLDDQIAVIRDEETDATKDIQAEIDRITKDLRAQLDLASEPFQQRIAAARRTAADIDVDARVQLAIDRVTPVGDDLRSMIGEAFAHRPALRWTTALRELADETEIDDGGAE